MLHASRLAGTTSALIQPLETLTQPGAHFPKPLKHGMFFHPQRAAQHISGTIGYPAARASTDPQTQPNGAPPTENEPELPYAGCLWDCMH
jgi:hypothetical protein